MSAEPMDAEELREEVERLHTLLEGKTQYVDCICPGCPRKVPEAWASGMCQPCCDEDCDHGDGAAAIAGERDRLYLALEALCEAADLHRGRLAWDEARALLAELRRPQQSAYAGVAGKEPG